MEERALMELFKDMIEYKKKEAKFLFIALIVVICMSVAEVFAFIIFEATMETTTTTTTTTEQQTSGDDSSIVNGDQVNGDQYNDKSQNRSE